MPSTSTRARTGHGLAIMARESLFLSTTYRWLCAEKQRSTPSCAPEPAMTKFIDRKAWVVTVNEIESELVTFEIAEARERLLESGNFRRANWPRPLSRVFLARSSSAPRGGGHFQRISRRLTRSLSTPNRALNTHRSRPSSRSSWCWWTVSSDNDSGQSLSSRGSSPSPRVSNCQVESRLNVLNRLSLQRSYVELSHIQKTHKGSQAAAISRKSVFHNAAILAAW